MENFTAKTRKFSDKNSDIFHISAQNIYCGTRYNRLGKAVLTSTHNLCVLEQKLKKINKVYPCKPQFYYIKVGFKGIKII